MFYKTLHWYVLKELLRIFLMAASVLTTLFAFGGSFKSVTKGGIEIFQLLLIMANLMPAMLAYTIPIAALFAAVLVYWRLSTDNELTACRASGISFWAVLGPALFLGIIVASVDLVFVNFVVPTFLQKTERLARADLGPLLVSTIGQKETFKDPSGQLLVYADDADILTPDDPGISKIPAEIRHDKTMTFVQLRGVAATKLKKDGKPMVIMTAMRVVIQLEDKNDSTIITVPVIVDAVAYDPTKFQVARGNSEALQSLNQPYTIESLFKNKPKFSNLFQLKELGEQPWNFEPVQQQLAALQTILRHQDICNQMIQRFTKTGILTFENADGELCTLTAPLGWQDVATLGFSSDVPATLPGQKPAEKQWVMVEVQRQDVVAGKTVLHSDRFYRCDKADLSLDSDADSPVVVTLNLRGKSIDMRLVDERIPFHPIGGANPMEPGGKPVESLSNLTLPEGIKVSKLFTGTSAKDFQQQWESTFKEASKSNSKSIIGMAKRTRDTLKELDHTISSELQSRGSFAVSCLTLVLFGAALGVMLRGRNPLAVFVLGFMPSVLLVLLITMGRRVMETANGSQAGGMVLLWAGNIVLLILVTVTYGKLVRT